MMALLERRLRLASGLVVATFVILHLGNHSLGLLSIELMERVREVISPIWSSTLGGIVLLGSLSLHFLLALWSLFRRGNLRMPPWEGAQFLLGLAVPPLLAAHLLGTRIAADWLGIEPSYYSVTASIWLKGPWSILKQSLLLIVVWLHLVVGLHYWLRLYPWYGRWLPALQTMAVLFPLLALLGFYRAGLSVQALATDRAWLKRVFSQRAQVDPERLAVFVMIEPIALWTFAGLLVLVFAGRAVRRAVRNAYGSFTVTYPSGLTVRGQVGQTLLEVSRAAGYRHASVCGGRGRCSTCRVQVNAGQDTLALPSTAEQKVLERIDADADVRLACQTRPRRDISITPLLPGDAGPADMRRPGGVHGRELRVATLFVDLRDSTGMAERRLPYDVVYVLNRFFAEMTEALADTGGHYAQFNGDGLMALYGLKGSYQAACHAAIEGAFEMQRRVEVLNAELAKEGSKPLSIGVGVHCGEAIVGEMGPPDAPLLTAIGDNINIAARLESLSKDFGCGIVVSAEAVEAAGLDFSGTAVESADVRGRDAPVSVYTVPRGAAMPHPVA
jgi:adenylate cyclase